MVYDPLYVFIIILISIGILLYDIGHKKKKKGYFLFVYLFLALVAELRYGVSPDTMNYMTAYDNIPKLQDITLVDFLRFRFDILYTLVNSVAKTICDSFLLVQIIHGLLLYVSLYKLLKCLKIDKFYVLLFFYLQFYFTLGMCIMRQGMAVGIVFFALPYLIRKEYWKYYLLIVIAFLFHASASIAFLFPLFYVVKEIKIKILFIFLVVFPFLFPVLVNFFSNTAEIIGGSLAEFNSRYKDSALTNFSLLNYGKNLIFFILIFGISDTKRKLSIIDYLGFLYLFFDMGTEDIPIFFRFKDYLFPFFLYAFCHFIENAITNRRVLLPVFAMVLFFYQPIAVHLAMFCGEYSHTLVPYASYLSDENHFLYDRNKVSFVPDYMNW